MKKYILKFTAFIFLIFVFNISLAQSIAEKKPNIIFILTDDLGYGDLGVFFQQQRAAAKDHAKPFEMTPQLDRMAQEGAVFTDQYSNAPVCAPSRASFLTGVNQGNANVRNNQFDKALENNHNVATVLKNAGYATAAIGKWGLQGEKEEAPNWPAHPLKRGFDYFFGYMRHVDGHEHYPYEGLYRGKKEVWENYTNVAATLAKSYTTDLWTAKAKQWIINQEQKHNNQPFFMFLAYDAPHAVLELPTQPYPDGGGLYGGVKWLGKENQAINTASGNIDSYVFPDYANATYDHDSNPNTPEIAWPSTYQRYATSTRRIDDGVGDILKLLKDLNIDDNTLVIFTSDNGSSIESYLPANYVSNLPTFFGSNGPFDGIKRDCWEGGLRVPTIAKWVNTIAPGKVIKTPSMLSDWLPTFAQAAQVEVPARADGESLMPLLTDTGNYTQSNIYVEYFEGGKTPNFKEFDVAKRNRKRGQMQMIRFGDFVGVRYNIKSADDDFEIYNVVNDPKQSLNLATQTSFHLMQVQMKEKAIQYRSADSTAKRPYDKALINPIITQAVKGKGVVWKFYENKAEYVTKHTNSKVSEEGISTSLNAKKSFRVEGTKVIQGYWEVLKDGKYTLKFQSNKKAFVRLHESNLFDADYNYQLGKTLSKEVYLKKGLHPITIYVKLAKGKKEKIKLNWEYESDNKEYNLEKNLYYIINNK